MILLKLLSGPFRWEFSPSSIAIILGFGLFLVFQSRKSFYERNFLFGIFHEQCRFFVACLLCLRFSLPYLVFWLILSNFSVFRMASLCFLYYIYFHFQELNTFISFSNLILFYYLTLHLITSFLYSTFYCIFLCFFKGLTHSYFNNL